MLEGLSDKNIGLEIKNDIDLIPNRYLSTLMGMYSTDIVSKILEENPGLVDKWLEKLHNDFIAKKNACEIQKHPASCFDMKGYEGFERNYSGWTNGGCIKIMINKNYSLWICRKPVKTEISLSASSDDNVARNSFF